MKVLKLAPGLALYNLAYHTPEPHKLSPWSKYFRMANDPSYKDVNNPKPHEIDLVNHMRDVIEYVYYEVGYG